MRSSTVSLSSLHSSSPLLNHRRRQFTSNPDFLNLNRLQHGASTTIPSISKPANLAPILGIPFQHSRGRGNVGFRPKVSSSVNVDDDCDDELTTTTVVEEEEEKVVSGGLWDTLGLAALFGSWTLFNIYFNIYNKQVLRVYQFPVTVTVVQFAIGTVLVLFMWTTNLYKKPKISSSQLVAILPLAIVHTLGNLFTNMSLGKVAVSFTHTIKASEPFFSVLLSAIFLGEMPTFLVVSSLVPIVGGVALASMTEASFNWAGFWSAMASNLTNQSRNVLSKKFMVKKEESLDNITLFSVITIMSFFLLAPFTFVVEGLKVTPSYLQSAGLNLQEIYIRSLLAGLCFHAYQQVSYMILAKVSPVTHSVGNCVKRVVVIVTSVLFFRTPVSLINSLGTGVALLGVFLYSRVKKIKPKKA